MSASSDNWWEIIPLEEMSDEQWESLCDGCGKCCMVKIWYDSVVKTTQVGCQLLNIHTAKCKDYSNRQHKVSNCIKVTLDTIDTPGLLPDTCAYMLIRNHKPLYNWHYLVSGDRDTIVDQHASIVGLAETTIDEISATKMQDYMLKAIDYYGKN
jgi:uncharacterized cysteine cluster protein YcgN (CxxCxxCC family)